MILVVLALIIAGVSFLVSIMVGGSGQTPEGVTQTDSNQKSSATTPCDPADIKLTAIVNQETFAEGELPQLSMKIENTGTTECSLNAGTDQQKYIITSGADPIWDSTVCQTGAEPYEITLAAGASQTTNPLEWSRTRSDNCDSGTAVVGGGATYQLAVYLGSIQSAEPVAFMLY